MTNSFAGETVSTDVLVVGGGPAGTWAAIKAAEVGVDVILADKGYTGASGATASVGTGVWYVDDVSELREAAMASREALGGHLADREWMTRVLDETHARMDELAEVQRYPFPVDAAGRSIRDDLQGPEYMRRQRLRAQRLGVRILDHTPAVELLVDDEGMVSGATVLDRASGRALRVEAAAVVLAAGGCAFQSKTLGCDVNTGDGALMAVEAGGGGGRGGVWGGRGRGGRGLVGHGVLERVCDRGQGHLADQDRVLLVGFVLPRRQVGARGCGQSR